MKQFLGLFCALLLITVLAVMLPQEKEGLKGETNRGLFGLLPKAAGGAHSDGSECLPSVFRGEYLFVAPRVFVPWGFHKKIGSAKVCGAASHSKGG